MSGFTCEANSDLLVHHQRPQHAITSDAANRKVNDSQAPELGELSVSRSVYKTPKIDRTGQNIILELYNKCEKLTQTHTASPVHPDGF